MREAAESSPPASPFRRSGGRSRRERRGVAVARTAGRAYIAAMRKQQAAAAVAAHRHDHRAQDHSGCAHAHGHIRLTPSRQLVLDKLCAAGRPVGAYDMIDIVAEETGKRPAPVSIYRALDFLLENGLVHRLASRNAFMACAHRHERSAPVAFLICEQCGRVTEATSAEVSASLSGLAQVSGFQARSQVIELSGLCAACASGEAAQSRA